jgi:futalosine hydrolase
MEIGPGIDVAILGAVPQEISALIGFLSGCRVYPFRCQTIWVGKYSNLSVLIGTTGLGKVNAAITTASLLERFSVAQVWNVGCAGAYSEGPLQVGDVLITNKAFCGDEGVITQKGLLPVSEIGIPLVACNGEEFCDYFSLYKERNLSAIIEKTPPGFYRQQRLLHPSRAYFCAEDRQQEPHRSGAKDFTTSSHSPPPVHSADADHPESDLDIFRLIHGPALTVSMASGDPEVAGERFQHHGAYAENMEGSAVVQTCFRFHIPVMECRGISNIAGVRSKETWQLEKSIAHCHGIVINWLDALSSLNLPE